MTIYSMANSTIQATYMTSGQYVGQVRFIISIGVGDPLNWGGYVYSKQNHGLGSGGSDPNYPYFVEKFNGSNNATVYKTYSQGNYVVILALQGIGEVDYSYFDVGAVGGELGLISIPSNITLAVGETKTITATCKDTYGNNMTCPTLTFSSEGGYITFDAITYNSITIRGVKAGQTKLDVKDPVRGIANYSNVTVTAPTTTCSRTVKVQEGSGSVKVYKNNALISTVTTSQTFTGLTDNDTLKLDAVPASGYIFQKWCDESNSCVTGSTWQLGVYCTFTSREYRAYFLQQITSVNITVTRKSGNGKVNVYQNNGFIGFLSDAETSKIFSFQTGSQFKFESVPGSGYIFDKYCQAGGINCITTDPFTGTVTSARTVEVYFKQSGGATNYNCVSGQCQGPFATGEYGSLAACQVACTITPTKYNCVSGQCQGPYTEGTFDSYADCVASGCGGVVNNYGCVGNQCLQGYGNLPPGCNNTCGGGEIDPCTSCNKDTQYCLFGSCYKKNDVYMAAGAVVLLMILTKK